MVSATFFFWEQALEQAGTTAKQASHSCFLPRATLTVIVIMKMVGERLHTMTWSVFRGFSMMLLMAASVPAAV